LDFVRFLALRPRRRRRVRGGLDAPERGVSVAFLILQGHVIMFSISPTIPSLY
jgi:hypothetical protein